MKFVGRKKELEILKQRIESKKSELFVLYGRRRIGKTTLCLELLKTYKGVYFLSSKDKESYNIQNFKQILAEKLEDSIILSLKDTWEDIFTYLSKKDEKIVIIIDEFPYLIEENKALTSIFQRIWDLILSKSKIKLILTGSSISMIENEILSAKSPLYGRRTGQLKLEKLKFKDLKEFFPKYRFDSLLKVYATLDSIPFYLEQ